MTTNVSQELLARLCQELRLMHSEAGGPSLRALAVRMRLSKSQLGAILNGQVRKPPDWRVVAGLVDNFGRYAREHGRTALLSMPMHADQSWRQRHAMVEYAFREGKGTRPVASPPAGETVVERPPRELPAAIRHFTGRRAELDALTGMLDAICDTGDGALVVAIWGSAGVGKSALAVTWAHQVAERFPDGQLHVNLRGFDPSGPPMSPGEAVWHLLEALCVPHDRIPDLLEARVGLYRSILADKKVLVLLDNARTADQVRPLLPATSGCLALVTSRNQLSGLVAADSAQPVALDLLSRDESHQLLARRLGKARVAAEPRAVADIIDRCARLPLALAIAAARALIQPDRSLGELADQLCHTRQSLEPLAGDDPATNVRTVFSWSYHALSPDAARMFRLLALAPGPDIGAAAASSLAGFGPQRTVRALGELVRKHLLSENAGHRYAFHDLLRTYAIEQAYEHDVDQQCQAAIHRVLDHYLHTAHRADRRLLPTRTPITLTPACPGVRPEPIADEEQALAWFTIERPALLAATDQAARYGLHTHTWQLAWTLATFLGWQGYWQESLLIHEAALAAAVHSLDLPAQALCARTLARVLVRVNRCDDAHRHLHESVDICADLGDRIGQAHGHLNMGEVYLRQGRLEDALHHARQALDLYRSAGHAAGEANALNNSGWLLAQLGDYAQALRHCEQALVLHQRNGDRQGEATTWDSLADTYRICGEHERAISCYQNALRQYRRIGHRYYEATALVGLGDTYRATNRVEPARQAWREALDILTELHHSDTTDVASRINRLDQPSQTT